MSHAMAVAGVPFDLVEVKLAAPLTRPGTVAKTRLIARLRTSVAPLATVVAPAGYGKTTLLSRWAEADARAFAWIALDGRDDDALVFMRYKRHLRRLAVHDDALLDELAVDGRASAPTVLDDKTAALLRIAATVAVDAAPYSFQHAVALALDAGATTDEIVASLEAVTPVTGAARVVQCAPKVALALGYDVDAALERHDP